MHLNRRGSSASTVVTSSMSDDIRPEDLKALSTLGRGSYGKVVLAQVNGFDMAGDRSDLVALKMVPKSRLRSKSQIEKAATELRIMKEVAPFSPFLVSAHGAFQTNDCLFFVMPYSAGGELFFHLQREGRFPESRARVMAMQILLGLEHLHANGVLYRDLKPENVLINADGQCQLADFGLGKFLKPASSTKDFSQNAAPTKRRSMIASLLGFRRKSFAEASMVKKPSWSSEEDWAPTRTKCGTPAYQPPEIVLAKEHSLEADWWSFGVLLYELLTGEPPFFASTVKDVYDLILANKPVFLKWMSQSARSLISQLLVSDRRSRLGFGRNGIQAIKMHPFFTNVLCGKTYKAPTWDDVRALKAGPVIDMSSVESKAREAISIPVDTKSVDMREYIVPLKNAFSVEGFMVVPEDAFDEFVCVAPLPTTDKEKQDRILELVPSIQVFC